MVVTRPRPSLWRLMSTVQRDLDGATCELSATSKMEVSKEPALVTKSKKKVFNFLK